MQKKNGKLRNRINVTLVNSKKDCIKSTSKPIYISHKILDNNLFVIRKSKIPIKLNRSAYTGQIVVVLQLKNFLG